MFFHHLPPTSPRNDAHVAAYMQDRQGFAEDLPTFVGGVQADVVFRSQVFSKWGPADGQFERQSVHVIVVSVCGTSPSQCARHVCVCVCVCE